ncbi:MAG: hypothetical protein N2747_00400 [Chitinophagaceae bacterium]|nr:hypothetical protein [Chitinophagaceae bacterium]
MPFNSRQYEWADLRLSLGGREITAIRAVKYTEKVEREVVYGKGNKPLSIQSGNYSYEGEITLLQSEYESLQKSAGPKGLLSLQLDVVVSYGNPANGDAMTTDRIEGLMFTEAGKELKQGDKFMEITLPFIALNIVRNI